MDESSTGGPADAVGPPPDVEVVLHAERLRTGTRRVPAERVRVRKQVVTTTRTIEVPVRVEQLVITREPVADAASLPVPGDRARDDDLVLVLHEEVPEVVLRVVPVERVVVGVRTVTGERTVRASLSSERVEVLGADGTDRTPG